MLAFLRRHAAVLPWPFFALASVLFYSIPLFSRNATIHWDLADVSYPAQKFFADSLHAWKLPQWTPYLDSGIPFLADPRTGAWYPLHWPFFAIGITPRALVWELALHAFLAMAGACLLGRRLFDTEEKVRGPAALGGLLYGLGGFFAAHSSALSAFEAAALLPWLLWSALTALETQSRRWSACTALIGGFIVLAGDPAAAVESLLALVCVVLATRNWKRGALLIATTVILAVMLGGIQVAPALDLHSQSHPASMSPARFQIGALATLVAADFYNLVSGLYSGPEDPREHYLYGGLLLLPLAISGFARRERWMLLVAMIAPTVVFDVARQPPGAAWFPAALGLAMAAASGVMWIETRMERPHVWAALLLLSAVDLWFWNLYKNPLVFAHTPFQELYGKPQPGGVKLPPAKTLSRTWAPYPPLGVAPADGSLIAHTEVTYGYGLAELDRYSAYMSAVDKNPKLLNGLAVTGLIFGRGREIDNPDSLGRVSVPPRVVFVAERSTSANPALTALATLDPAKSAVVEGPERRAKQGVDSLEIMAYTGDAYRIKYSASSDSLLRIAVPYYPGWTAAIDGVSASIIPVDEALMGVFVPPGEHELTLYFQPRRFLFGLSLTVAAAIALVIGLILT
jgi:hypothetical protein